MYDAITLSFECVTNYTCLINLLGMSKHQENDLSLSIQCDHCITRTYLLNGNNYSLRHKLLVILALFVGA